MISFEGQPVTDLSIVLFQIFNSGNQPVPQSDFAEPLAIAIRGQGRMLAAEVTETVPEELVESVTIERNESIVAPRLFNEGDVITLKLVVTELQGSLQLKGRVVGVSEFANAALGPFRSELLRLLWALACLEGGVITLIAVGLLPVLRELPESLGVPVGILAMVPGILAANWIHDRVIRGPRRRSREFNRVRREREAGGRRGNSSQ